jgi:hypothetical protein
MCRFAAALPFTIHAAFFFRPPEPLARRFAPLARARFAFFDFDARFRRGAVTRPNA